MMRPLVATAAAVAGLLVASRAEAWLLVEHARAGRAATQEIAANAARGVQEDARAHALLDQAWTFVRGGDAARATRLCPEYFVEWAGGAHPRCLGLAALPALAGDHACTTADLDLATRAPWLDEVLAAAIDRQQKIDAYPQDDIDARQGERRSLDEDLETADAGYLFRAAGSHVHFQMPRARTMETAVEYMDAALRAVPNATAAYIAYHTRALALAVETRRRCGGAPCAAASDLLWLTFLEESFALHFLEDSFAAGHMAGVVDGTSYRMGTHDYYSSHGLDVRTWSGESYAAYGDAFLDDTSLHVVGHAVAASLRQLAWALSPKSLSPGDAAPCDGPSPLDPLDCSDERALPLPTSPMDSCSAAPFAVDPALAQRAFLGQVLRLEPIPALEKPTLGRDRKELGVFVPFALELSTGYFGGRSGGAYVEPSLALGVGWAADAILSDYSDPLFFLEARGAMQARGDGSYALGIGGRMRIPYAVVPGDILVWGIPAAVLQGKSPRWVRAAVLAAMRGGERFDQGARLQFVGGREVGAFAFHDVGRDRWSWSLELPLIEVRATHGFRGRLAEDIDLQLGMTVGGLGGDFGVGIFLGVSNRARFYAP